MDPEIERQFDANRAAYQARSEAINEGLRAQRERIVEGARQADARLTAERAEVLAEFVKQNRRREDGEESADKVKRTPNPWLEQRNSADVELSIGPEEDEPESPAAVRRPAASSPAQSRRRRPAVEEEDEEDFSVRFDEGW